MTLAGSSGRGRHLLSGERTRAPLIVTIVVAVLAVLIPSVLWARPAVAASPCGPPVVSVIACENTLAGDTPSDWQVSGAGDPSIQGFATSMSVNLGETITFKINTAASSYHLDILRMGYYQGSGARKVVAGLRPTATLPQSQPSCLTDSTSGLIDCGNWGVSASWAVPSTAVSGVYLAHLVRDDTGGGSLIPFVVRNDASTSDIVVQTSDETWQAYNTYGGNSLYQCTVACPPGNPGGYKGAYKVSYNRPFHTAADDSGRSWLMYTEYPMIRFMEANGYDVSYTSGADVATRGSLLTNHKVFLSVGHDEYWSGDQRANVESARDHGVNLAFFSGNEVFWKTRWEASTDGTNTPSRTLVSYKETHFDAPVDPKDPPTWTGTWRDPRFSPPADGGRPENALTGQFFIVNSGTTDIQVPSQYSALRLWRNTAVAKLAAGQSLTLGAGLGTLGYEWDEDADNGSRPAGLFDLSSTTSTTAQTFIDYGTNVASNRTATHHLTMYRAASGALVFGAGTVHWSWGLDGATTGRPPDPTMQQATVNLFADMAVQPYALISGLTPATRTSDSTPPSSALTSPTGTGGYADGAKITITGTATDAGGGVVAGVEVSTNGGRSWHPAIGTTSWSYTWIAHGSPTTTILSRAVDDSGNVETPSTGVKVSISCPCSVWGGNVTPGGIDSGDAKSVEVGVKFSADTFGAVSGVRFYKAGTNTGTHVGNLWSATGQLLARATFTNESASGWQQVAFATAVPISANTTYVASYYAPVGHYSQDAGYMYPHPAPEPDGNDSLDSAPLHVLRNTPTSGNGLYSYSNTTTFPTSTYAGENYWVDVVFTPSPVPGQPTNVVASAGNASAGVSWNAPTTGGAVTSYTVTPYIGTTAQPSTTVSGTPAPTSTTVAGLTNGTTYTFVVTASNPNGSGPPSKPSNAVTPSAQLVVTSTSPAAGSTGIAVTAPVSAVFSQPVSVSSIVFTLNSGSTSVAGVVSYNSTTQTATFTPSTALQAGTTYTASVSATDTNGNAMSSPATWTFTTAAALLCPCSLFPASATPATVDSGDASAVNLGVKITPTVNGFIAGVRFYKASTNTGVHTGTLWSSTGSRLATGTFTNETSSGWQTLTFATPVAVTANTTYVVSYYTPTGHYSFNSGFFNSTYSNPPLTAPAGSNGVYLYGAAGFPTSSYNNTNYWVDTIFTTK